MASTLYDAQTLIRAKLTEMRKARLSAAHQELVGKLRELHDAHPHLQEHLGPLIAQHAPKPAKTPRTPKPVDPDAARIAARKVNDHVVRLNYHLGHDSFDGVHAEVAGHPTAHVHAVAKAFTGAQGRSKKRSLELIQKKHNVLVGARAREASRDGRTAG